MKFSTFNFEPLVLFLKWGQSFLIYFLQTRKGVLVRGGVDGRGGGWGAARWMRKWSSLFLKWINLFLYTLKFFIISYLMLFYFLWTWKTNLFKINVGRLYFFKFNLHGLFFRNKEYPKICKCTSNSSILSLINWMHF